MEAGAVTNYSNYSLALHKQAIHSTHLSEWGEVDPPTLQLGDLWQLQQHKGARQGPQIQCLQSEDELALVILY